MRIAKSHAASARAVRRSREWTNPAEGSAPVREVRISDHAVHRHEVDDQQVDRVGAQAGPVLDAAAARARRPGGGVHLPAGASHRVLVVLGNGHGDQRNLVLLVAVDHTQVDSAPQVGPADAGAFRKAPLVVIELVLLTPAQCGPGCPGLLALARPGRLRPPLLTRWDAARTVVSRRRHRRVRAVARDQVPQPLQLGLLLLELAPPP